jgi:hypothetical protein
MDRRLIPRRCNCTFHLKALPSRPHAVLPRVSTGYPPSRGRSPTCYSPVRHSRHHIATVLAVRLACLKRAASVRSEPGSNSRLKLVAWAKKNALRLESESQPAQANYCRSIYSDHSCSKRTNGFERILAHRIGCQRARASCHAESTANNFKSMPRGRENVNWGLRAEFQFSTDILRAIAGPLLAAA